MTNLTAEMKALLSGLRRAEAAAVAGIPETKLANWQAFGFLRSPTTRKGKWNTYTDADMEALIYLAALVEGVGLPPSKASKLVKAHNLTLAEAGVGDFAEIIMGYFQACMTRAQKLHAERAREAERLVEQRGLRAVQRAIAALPNEETKIAALQDLVRHIAPEHAAPVLGLAVGALGEAEKLTFLASFLEAHPEVWGRVVLNSLAHLDRASKERIATSLFEEIAPRREALGTEVCVGEHASRGVHVSFFEERVRLLISAGSDEFALCALLSPADAEQVLEAWRAELASRNGGEESTTVEASREPAPVTAVQVLPGRAIRISAGASGSIVASLSETAAKVVFNSLEGAIDELRGRQATSNVFSVPLRPGAA